MSTAAELIQSLRQKKRLNASGNDEMPSLFNRYQEIRQQSLKLCHELEIEDYELQADDFVSPTKWHLAHTSWFFETFVLKNIPDYQPFHSQFEYLFNSDYATVGKYYPREQRGLMSRPTVSDIKYYRQHVDQKIMALLDTDNGLTPEQIHLVLLGLNHEQQHQELILTDLKYNLSFNPLYPIYATAKFPEGQAPESEQSNAITPLEFIEFGGGVYNFGKKGSGFCFDNETPRHQALVNDFRLANRLITNAEFCQFIDAGGYQNPQFWLADGWQWIQKNAIKAPLYWHLESENRQQPQRYEFRLTGYGQLHPQQPVTHVSFYEADAYARWAGKRLPSEYEWEIASKKRTIEGTFVESKSFHPLMVKSCSDDVSNKDIFNDGMKQLFGDCWQWTKSAYSPYPGFKTAPGPVGEYNGKFMCNQMVLRGGSCATPKDHIRATYRNALYPQDRWQFTGIRLAEDV